MLKRWIRHPFGILLLVTLLTTLGLHRPAPAQVDQTVPGAAAAIALPFNADTDGTTLLPADLSQSDAPYDDSRVVIGADDRLPVLTREFPWVAMGRLEWQIQGEALSTCTATLIGPSAILTNSHCLILPLPDGSGDLVNTFIEPGDYRGLIADNADLGLKLVFKPSLIEGIALDESEIVSYEAGWSTNYMLDKDDWAVLRLAADLGNYYGYMGWRNLDFDSPDVLEASFERINLLGYSGDFPTENLREFGLPSETAGVDQACSVLGIWHTDDELNDTLVHDCDTNPGASGGPIFALFDDNNYYLVGLHARSTPLGYRVNLPNGVETDVVNGGVKVSRWEAAAYRGR
ncbi:trypsin-like serine peptidase [Nodosilinea sp. AN01ver1]|uniref:trypsin-like serine peptidase n=1 Tax=Nodosilinea sp. AN01ver1 TaxID=3423362 RepID=UPI003D31DE23